MNMNIKAIGAKAVADSFAVAAVAISPAVAKLVDHFGAILESQIKAHASGRPGPNAPTGDYRRSWNSQPMSRGTTYAVIVGTNKPQGRRLEYGFVGVDSLGRHYNQPPFPHVQPSVAIVKPAFEAAVGDLVKAI